MSNEARVGIFVIIILAIFIILSMKIGELSFSKKSTYPITMVFSTVEGLKISSPLELAGVEVGKVTGISLNKDYTAVVSAALNEDIRLPIDSTASIGTKGVLGDKIIILSPGVSSGSIEPGGNLARTKVPPSLDTLLTQVGELAQNLTELSAALNASFGDEEALHDIVLNLRDLSVNTSTLVADNKEDITAIISNMRMITEEFTFISENLTTTSRNIDEITSTISSGQGSLGKLVKDDTLYDSMVTFMESADTLMAKMNGESTLGMLMTDSSLYDDLAQTAENLRVITDDMASGRGTLGRLMTDDEIYLTMREALVSANKAMQGLEEQTPITVFGTVLGIIW
ncbi:MAG TPA: MlaD family protein [Deltaproteobacteria bacterium]|nr:MlaD family protein [Deltaproteobacteria bacterium]HPR53859.1 MlaD family protein [Deltaproteobacteria bacterium]HXK45941.1 MlaD family protein [Deltaproteobacteria bacterium]